MATFNPASSKPGIDASAMIEKLAAAYKRACTDPAVVKKIEDMGNLSGIKAVPAFYVAHHYLGDVGVVALMLALFGVILTSLIGNTLALSRLLYAAGRDGEAPQALSRLSRGKVPVNAILI